MSVLTSVCAWMPVMALLAMPQPPPSILQAGAQCDCHPDSYSQVYECCDVLSYYLNITTPAQNPRCFDFGNCNEQSAVPCGWLVTMVISTATHHNFEAISGGQVVVSSDDARGLNWRQHRVTLDCDTSTIELLTCDGAACLEADMACWDCMH